jgi:hypothetical protein
LYEKKEYVSIHFFVGVKQFVCLTLNERPLLLLDSMRQTKDCNLTEN